MASMVIVAGLLGGFALASANVWEFVALGVVIVCLLAR